MSEHLIYLGLYQRRDGTVYKRREDGKWFYLSPLFGEWLEVFDQPNDGTLMKYPRNLGKITDGFVNWQSEE